METLEVVDEVIDTMVPGTGIEPDLDMFEIAEDNAPTADDLAAQLAAKDAELAELKKQSDLTAGMQQGFQSLAQQLQTQQAPDYSNLPGLPAANSNQTPQSYALPNKEDFEKDFFTNPYDAMTRMLAPALGNQQSALTSQMAEMNKMISKTQVYTNESNKDILSKYGDEVEVYASRLGGKNPYEDAVKQVTMNHFADIMSEKTKSASEQAYEKALADLRAEQGKATPSPVGTTAMGTMTNPTPAKVKVTKAQMDKVKMMTATKFGPDSGPEVELQMYNYMKDNGML